MYSANMSIFTRFWNTMQILFLKCVDAFTAVLDFSTIPIENWPSSIDNPFLKGLVQTVLELFPYSDYSISEFMFGSGLVIFIIVAVVKFFADILT